MKKGIEIILDTAFKIHPSLPPLIEIGVEYVPYLGKALQSFKIYRLEKRMKEHSEQLKRISKLYSNTLLSEKFIQERIAPIVLSDLIEEHEDAKISLILNGFENVFIEENSNESVIINYLDSLRSLRYIDIKRFLYFSHQSTDYPDFPENSDEKALTRRVDGKLEILGLVKIEKTWAGLNGYDTDNSREKVELTLYGNKFSEFIFNE